MEYVSIFLGDESSRKVSWKTKKDDLSVAIWFVEIWLSPVLWGNVEDEHSWPIIRLYRWRFYVGCNMITLYVLDSYLLPTNHKLSEPGTICAQTEFKPLEGEGGKQWLGVQWQTNHGS